MYLVDEETVVDFVKSLGEIHDEHVRLENLSTVCYTLYNWLDNTAIIYVYIVQFLWMISY